MKARYVIPMMAIVAIIAFYFSQASVATGPDEPFEIVIDSIDIPFRKAILHSGCSSCVDPVQTRKELKDLRAHAQKLLESAQGAGLPYSENPNLTTTLAQIVEDIDKAQQLFEDEFRHEAHHLLHTSRSRLTNLRLRCGICKLSDMVWCYHDGFHEVVHASHEITDKTKLTNKELKILSESAANTQRFMATLKAIANCEPYSSDEKLATLLDSQEEATHKLVEAVDSGNAHDIKKAAKKLRDNWGVLAEKYG